MVFKYTCPFCGESRVTFVTAETVDTVLSVALNHQEGETAFSHQDLVLDVNNKGYNPSIQQ